MERSPTPTDRERRKLTLESRRKISEREGPYEGRELRQELKALRARRARKACLGPVATSLGFVGQIRKLWRGSSEIKSSGAAGL